MRWRFWSGLLAVSVLLHLFIFWPSPVMKPGRMTAAPLSVRIATLPAESAEAPAGARLPRRAALDGAQAARAERRPRVAEGAQKQATIREKKSKAAEPADTAGQAVRIAEASAPPEEAQAATGVAASSAVSLARYRFALAAAAVRLQQYPRAAIEAGLEGTVIVEVRRAALLDAPLISLGRSSGVAELDNEALALLERAVRAVPVSRTNQGQAFFMRLPVRFELPGN